MIVPKPIDGRSKAQIARDEADAYETVTLRDNDTCQRCHRNCGPIARDHRKNRGQGGPTVTWNLQCLGLGCHTWKTEHPTEAVEEGWAVPGWPLANPRQWPARRWIRTTLGTMRLAWVLYGEGTDWREITEDAARDRMFVAGWAA